MRSTKKPAALAAAALLLGLAPAKAQTEHTSMVMPALAYVFLSTYVAEDAGIWAKEGLDVKVSFVSGVGAFNAVLTGSADFSNSSGLTIDRAAARGQRLLAIANVLNRLPLDVVIRKDIAEAAHFDPAAPLLQRAKIIAGRTMAVDGLGSIVHGDLLDVMKAGEVDPQGVQITPMQPADMLAAFARKSIDGFSNGPPWPQRVLTDGSAVLVASGEKGEPPGLYPLAFGLIVARPQFCQDHRSICLKMGHSMVEAAKFIHEHQDETRAILKKRFPDIPDKAAEASFEEVRDNTPLSPVVTEEALANADKMNLEAGLIKPADALSSYKGLSTDEFVR
ncbi:MAG TPA: ABC transporter substrate-binding protein [Stellaceae bacterium]|nr:ABC transporter substrate-binding protein [Stellaceae bacterium]